MRTSKGNMMIKTNIKMRVTSEESKQVQEICFANGLGWVGGDFTPSLLDKEYLMICDVITWDDKKRFCELNLEEVSANLFIKTKGTCIEETPEQALKQNSNNKNKEEIMEKNEVKSYADVKEYLIAKGLYERVLEIDWDLEVVHTEFNELFIWADAKEGYNFWNDLDDDLIKLRIEKKIESLVQDYKSKQGKEFIKHLEAQPEELFEAQPLEKPKQYLCYVQGKSLPKHIHKTLEQAKQEAQRLCRKELAKVRVLEVVAEFEAEVLVKEVL